MTSPSSPNPTSYEETATPSPNRDTVSPCPHGGVVSLSEGEGGSSGEWSASPKPADEPELKAHQISSSSLSNALNQLCNNRGKPQRLGEISSFLLVYIPISPREASDCEKNNYHCSRWSISSCILL